MNKLLIIVLITFSYAISTDDIYDNSWALIIGIDKYENVQHLSYAVKDAASIRDILTTSFGFPIENLIVLEDEDATQKNILKAFSEITKKAQENDRVLIFFAGHGETYDLPGGGEMGYLIPVEGKAEELYLTSVNGVQEM